MNYLAHLYLSGESDETMLGNFIGDYVKGKNYMRYSEGVARGILLHRSIDWYTDHHHVVKECSNFLKDGYGRYSGIVVDIFFDHFLARNWETYSEYDLTSFASHAYRLLISNFGILPLRVKQFLPFLIQSRRLESYASLEKLQQALDIMSRRTSLPENSSYAMDVLRSEYRFFEDRFSEFFQSLICHVEREYEIEIKHPISVKCKGIEEKL